MPGNLLIERMLQRGIDRGEFKPMDVRQRVYVVMAPLLFLALWTQSFGSRGGADPRMQPDVFLSNHLDTLLHGLCVPSDSGPVSSCVQGIMAPLPKTAHRN